VWSAGRGDSSDVAEEVLWGDGFAERLAEIAKERRLQVRLRSLLVRPQRKDTATKGTTIVVIIWYQRRERYAWARCR
jgi:hypothetical protein